MSIYDVIKRAIEIGGWVTAAYVMLDITLRIAAGDWGRAVVDTALVLLLMATLLWQPKGSVR
jgi:hypothetical protein